MTGKVRDAAEEAAFMMLDGCELRSTADGRGDGVFATRSFRADETVTVGVIDRRVEKNHSHATQVGRFEYVELAGLGPKVNHSCDPNCGIRINDCGAPNLVALRFIAGGEEVTFDYAMRNYSIEHFPSPCRCGSRVCRGSVTGWKDLPAERKRAYHGLVAPYLLDIEKPDGHFAARPALPTPREGPLGDPAAPDRRPPRDDLTARSLLG